MTVSPCMGSISPLPPLSNSIYCSSGCMVPQTYGSIYRLELKIRLVRDYIPEGHLFTHLSFSLTCRGIWQMYDDEMFWYRVCRANGLGVNSDITCPTNNMSWRHLATAFANHAVNCPATRDCPCFYWHSVPEAQISSLPCPLGRYARLISEQNHFTFDRNAPLTPGQVSVYKVECRPFRIVMALDPYGFSDRCKLSCYTYAREGISLPRLESKWSEHHPVARMFATDPPVQRIDIRLFHNILVINEYGVTIWDIISTLQDGIRMPFDLLTFDAFYHTSREFLPDLAKFCPLWTQTLRDFRMWLKKERKFLCRRGQRAKVQFARAEAMIRFCEKYHSTADESAEDWPIWKAISMGYLSPLLKKPTNVLINKVFDDYSYILPFFLGFGHPKMLLQYESLSSFLQNIFFTGLRQEKPGSSVFECLWESRGIPRAGKLLSLLMDSDELDPHLN